MCGKRIAIISSLTKSSVCISEDVSLILLTVLRQLGCRVSSDCFPL